MKTERFAFDDIDFMIRILQDFKEKANIDDYSERDINVPHKTKKRKRIMTPKEEAKRLVDKFTTFLNYDAQVVVNFNNFKEEGIRRTKKDAIKLSIMCLEEMISYAENDEYEVWFKSLIIELNNMKKDLTTI